MGGADFTEVPPVISAGGGLMGLDQAKRINAQPRGRLRGWAVSAAAKIRGIILYEVLGLVGRGTS